MFRFDQKLKQIYVDVDLIWSYALALKQKA